VTAVEPPAGAVAAKKGPGKTIGIAVVAILFLCVGGYSIYHFTRPEPIDTDVVVEPAVDEDAAAREAARNKERMQGLFNKGLEQVRLRKYDAAAASFAALLKEDPGYPGAENELKKARDEKENLEHLNKARHAQASMKLLTALDELSQVDEDSVFYKEASELKRQVGEKYASQQLHRAAGQRDKGNLVNALKYLDELLNVVENHKDALKMKKEIKQALRLAARSKPPPVREKKVPEVKRKKENPVELVRRGMKEAKAGNHLEAAKIFKRVQQLDSMHCKAILYTGISYANGGKKKQAAVYYRKFVRVCPGQREAPQVRGILKQWEESKKP
jgi:tetratricopeptide (TPR) repeat protein